jgi:MFS family permease
MRLQPMLSATQLDPAFGGLLHQSPHLQWAAIQGLPKAIRTPFGRFLLAWSVYNFGVAAFFAYYPLIMREVYGISPAITASAYAIAAGIGIFLFVGASRMAIRYGSRAVFQIGLALRLIGFGLLGFAMVAMSPGAIFVALFGFVLVMLAWPVLSVSGTALAARLTPVGEGAAIGLLGASGALATVAGIFASGPLVHAFGYGTVLPLAIAGLAVAELLMIGRRDPEAEIPPAMLTRGDLTDGHLQG